MKQFPYWLILTLSFITSVSLNAQHSKPLMQKEPAWVTLTANGYVSDKLDHEAEGGFIDVTFEKQVSLQSQESYFKKAIKILSEAGVQNRSEISVSYDPSYSRLIFHSIKIIRGTESINKLQVSKMKVIQQETELGMHLYNGTLSAVLFLEDVRKGDIIEYSYTIKGFNPIFKGKYSALLETSFSIPVYNLYYKVVMPKGRALNIKNSLTDITYSIKQTGDGTSYEWKLSNLPALRIQDKTPSWYDPYAMILISEFNNWKEVNDWALSLFPLDIRPSAELQKKIETIRSSHNSPEKRLLACLRFVQDDIRYMGIEMGANSHKPTHPDKVYAQRFGDCKDKSYLLCILLNGMGIEARPVLINTSYKKTISKWLPSATIFDHVTVRVKLNDTYYWLDPTITYQRGALAGISYPDYQCGLVIDHNTTALTNIPLSEKGTVTIKEVFKIPNMSGDVHLTVSTNYSGANADGIRSEFNNNSRFEMQKKFEDYYASYYEKINADSLTFTDDDNSGIFTTMEYYTIPNFWQNEKGVKKTYFSPYVISGVIKKPTDINRTMPFYIDYPARYKEDIEIHLPEDWNAEESAEQIECTSFLLKAKCSYANKKVLLHYEYESLKDHVMPDESKEFFASYKKVDDNIGYSLTNPEKGAVNVTASVKTATQKANSGLIILIVLIFIGGIVWWAQKT